MLDDLDNLYRFQEILRPIVTVAVEFSKHLNLDIKAWRQQVGSFRLHGLQEASVLKDLPGVRGYQFPRSQEKRADLLLGFTADINGVDADDTEVCFGVELSRRLVGDDEKVQYVAQEVPVGERTPSHSLPI